MPSAWPTSEKEHSTQKMSYTYLKKTNFSKIKVFRVRLKEPITQKRNFYPKISYTCHQNNQFFKRKNLSCPFERTDHLPKKESFSQKTFYTYRTRLAHLLKKSLPKNFLYLLKKTFFKQKNFVHTPESFYMKKKFLIRTNKIYYSCPKKTNIPNENNFL